MSKRTEIKVIEHPYYNDVLDTVVRVVKVNKDNKSYITYKGVKKEVLYTPSVGYHVWVYPEMVRR